MTSARKAEPTNAPNAPLSVPDRVPLQANLILLGSFLLSAAVMAIVTATLWQGRLDAQANAARTSENLVQVVTSDIGRNFEIFDLILQDIVDDLGDEAVDSTAASRHRFLSRAAAASDKIGSVLLLDAEGNIVVDSASPEPRVANFADRDYFLAHRDDPDVGIYASRPYESRLRAGDPSVALSRRLDGPQGEFAGIVMVAVRLAHLRELFERIDTGPGGTITLVRTDGIIVMREPSADGKGDVGRDVSQSPNFRRSAASPSGSFTGVAQIDGIERFYTFARVPGLPLIVNVALSSELVFAGWLRRAYIVGGLTIVVCVAAVGFAVRLRREIIRRTHVEADLAFLSITDGLTGLANRRRFDDVIAREWRRTRRAGSTLALLMIDADRFKQLNDKFGHIRGDEVLKAIARVIDGSIRRPGDMAARYGGEEFVAILPDTDAGGAAMIAEKIRRSVELGAGEAVEPSTVTVSIGVSVARPTGDETESDLIAAADHALYRAKETGRNRVVVEALAPEA